MKPIVIASIMLCSFQVVANVPVELSKDQVVDTIFNYAAQDRDWFSLTHAQEAYVKNVIYAELNKELALAPEGYLNLGPNTIDNAFLGSLIKKVGEAAETVIKDVVGFAKDVVRPIAKVGLKFLGMADSGLIKTVVGTAADIIAGAISKFAPLIGAVVSYIPIAGPTIALVIDAVAPWVDSVVNYDTVSAVASGIGKLANAFNFTDDVIAKAANSAKSGAASVAPDAEMALAEISYGATSDQPQATKAQKEKAGHNLAKMCSNYLSFIRKLSPSEYNNRLGENEKRAVAQCNHFATLIGSHGHN